MSDMSGLSDLKSKMRINVKNAGVEMEEALEHFEKADDISYQMFYLGQIMGVASRVSCQAQATADEVQKLK